MSNNIELNSILTSKDSTVHDAYTSTQGQGIFQYQPKMIGSQSPVGLTFINTSGLIVTDQNCSFLQAQNNPKKFGYTTLTSTSNGWTAVFEGNYTPQLSFIAYKSNAATAYNTITDSLEKLYYKFDSNLTTSTFSPTQYAIPMLSINGTYLASWKFYISQTPGVSSEQWNDVPDNTPPSTSPVSYLTNDQWQAIVDAYNLCLTNQDINLVSKVVDLIYYAKVVNQQSSNQQLAIDVGYGQRVFNAGTQSNLNLSVIEVALSNQMASVETQSGLGFGGTNSVTFTRTYNENSQWYCDWNVTSSQNWSAEQRNSINSYVNGVGAFNWDYIDYLIKNNNGNPAALNPMPLVQWEYWPNGQFSGTISSTGTIQPTNGPMNYDSQAQLGINELFDNFINDPATIWPNSAYYTTIPSDVTWTQLYRELNSSSNSGLIPFIYMWATLPSYTYKFTYSSDANWATSNDRAYFNGSLTITPNSSNFMHYVPECRFGTWSATAISAQVTIPVMSFSFEPLVGKQKVKKDETELQKLSDYYYNIADHIVAAYYNCLLQKEEYWLKVYNQGVAATPLQKVFALGVKFRFTSDILTEIINQYPFKVLPQSIQTMVDVINSGTTDTQQALNTVGNVVKKTVLLSDVPTTVSTQLSPADSPMSSYLVDNDQLINEIGLFLATPVPTANNVYVNNPDMWNDLQSAFNTFTSIANSDIVLPNGVTITHTPIDNTPLPNPLNPNGELMPSTFREIIKKVMSMGALIQHVEAYLRLGSIHNLLLSKNPITSKDMQLPTVTQVTASPYTIPATSMTNIGTVDTARNHQDLDSVRKEMDAKMSSIENSLIYPSFDTVMEDIKDEVAEIRQLTEDRLHGMSYAIYAPELRHLFAKRVGLTHRLIHMFSTCVKTVTFVVTPFYDLLADLDKQFSGLVSSLIMKPLTQTVETIAKVGLSMLISGSDLVSPGSELLTWMSDANIERPIPTPLSPFGIYTQPTGTSDGVDNRLFSKVVLNGNNTQYANTIANIECIVPGIGFAHRQQACCANVLYNQSLNSYALEVNIYDQVTSVTGTKVVLPSIPANPDNSKQLASKISKIKSEINSDIAADDAAASAGASYTPVIVSGNDSKMVIYNVTPGVHSIQFLTAAGSVRMWFSATQTLSDDGNSFVDANLSQSTHPNEYVSVGSKGFICFVPDPVVSIDGRISLPKTFHKWILAALHIPYFVFPRSEDTNYHNAIDYLNSLNGFDNLKSHICTDGMTYAYIADGAAMTFAWGMAIKQMCTAGIRSGLEYFSLASEYAANIAHITMEYNEARAANVLNAYINNMSTINNILASAWPCQGDGVVNMQLWEYLQDDIQSSPDFNVPGWYPESWERLLGDVILGIAKMTFFTYLQHKVFKKINQKATVVAKTKTKLSSVLWNKYKRHTQEIDTGKDVDKDLGNKNTAKDEKEILRKQDAQLDDSFIEDRDLEGLRQYTLNNSKSVKQLLNDQTAMGKVLSSIDDLVQSFGLLRGLN